VPENHDVKFSSTVKGWKTGGASMTMKLFVLGLPGSGKSAIARFILKYVSRKRVDEQNDQCCSVSRFNDYAILLDMFHQDTARKRFKPARPSGFDVLDLKVFDEALETLEQKVNAYMDSFGSEDKKLVLIEFSRNDYYHAFQQFKESFLKDAYFLYLDTELEKCKQRINFRSVNPKYPEDDYPVSKYIFEKYYHDDDWTRITGILAKEFGVDIKRVWTFCNNQLYGIACTEVEPFIKHILKTTSQEEADNRKNPPELSMPEIAAESPQTSPDKSGPYNQAECESQRDSSEKHLAVVVPLACSYSCSV
jgi:hypothetical protein